MTKAADLAQVPNLIPGDSAVDARRNLGVLPITWSDAEQVGNGLSISTMTSQPVIAALTRARVAFICSAGTQGDSLRTYDFDGTDWSQEGNSLALSVGSVDITALSISRIALIDSGNDELRAYDFDGTDWSLTGNGLAISGLGSVNVAIAALNETDVAVWDPAHDEIRTYRFDGTDWAQVGNALATSSSVTEARLVALTSTDVALVALSNTITTERVWTYRFDGTDWSAVGDVLSYTSFTINSATAFSETDLVLCGQIGATQVFLVFRFDGSEWALVSRGIPGPYGGTHAVYLTALLGNELASIDDVDDELRKYRFSYYPGKGPHSPVNQAW